VSDVADGVAARTLGAATRMGRILDPLVDVLFNCGIALGLFHAGKLPGWILTLALTRYSLLLLGGAWIYVVKGPVAIRPTPLGKTTGVITTGLVLGLLLIDFLPPSAGERVLELLYSTLGFVLLIAIVQVCIIGFYNMRHAGQETEAEGALGVVVGHLPSGERSGPHRDRG
jgi:phosphatidylglycerophosphate synthase